MSGTELELGAQSRAAAVLGNAIGPIQDVLKDLATSLEADAPGLRGASGSGLGKALSAWFEVATDLPEILGTYARNLVEVDVTEAKADAHSQDTFSRIAGRLGGQP